MLRKQHAAGRVASDGTAESMTATCRARAVHERMPVILAPGDYSLWLDPEETRKERLIPLLGGDPNGALVYHSVSRVVNSPRTDSPECVQEVEDPVGTDLWGRMSD